MEIVPVDAAGRVETVQFPGGEWLQLGRDVRFRITDELYWHGGGLLRDLHHAYDADREGRSYLRIRPLLWMADGWPVAGPRVAQG